ncbi:hypothetical protein FHR23_002252 [Stakelama sediminis]|uniref:Uncharacterized protein n=1 Tax=Stakelama sediminis TaxID=463200 RepID=A0A840YZR6_9SPHN|nr:hypothetical protein [Stakelama sediminis]
MTDLTREETAERPMRTDDLVGRPPDAVCILPYFAR